MSNLKNHNILGFVTMVDILHVEDIGIDGEKMPMRVHLILVLKLIFSGAPLADLLALHPNLGPSHGVVLFGQAVLADIVPVPISNLEFNLGRHIW